MNSFSVCLCICFYFASFFEVALSRDNGLAKTPPMGWLSWNTFYCEKNCKDMPEHCFSEDQITSISSVMISGGFKDAGYEYVIIDDCWMAEKRDAAGRLQPDPERFGKGIKWLADFIHERGLKFGIYEDMGEKTCQGLPGSFGHELVDVTTFASWGVDYLKLDGCYPYQRNASQFDYSYPLFGAILNATNRPIVFSCEWAVSVDRGCPGAGYPNCHHADYAAIREVCNLDRNMDDIAPVWESLISVIDYYDGIQDELINTTKPGAWSDPDMLLAGQGEITTDQAKLQMAIWSIWSAPLLISTDIRVIKDEFKDILLNKDVIAIDQDLLGIMGRRVIKSGSISVYVKPVTPVDTATGDRSYAIAFMNRDEKNKVTYSVDLERLGLTHDKGYQVKNLFEKLPAVRMGPKDEFKTTINPTGVTFIKATVIV